MATQTGSIDMAAMAEAAKTANNYVTDLGDSGIRVHPADDADNYAAIDASGMSVVRDSESVAHFGEETRIGKSGESHMELDYHSMRMVDREGHSYFHVSDLRDADGYLTEMFDGDGTTTAFTVSLNVNLIASVKVGGTETTAYTHVLGSKTFTFSTAPSLGDVVEIRYMPVTLDTKAYTLGRRADSEKLGVYSVAEGLDVIASGNYSHAEGYQTKSRGDFSHAEGFQTTVSSSDSHAEGYQTVASDTASHAEGYKTTASNDYSHAEGRETTASGQGSHAQNYNTIAAYQWQTAIGKYNANDSANAFEIGNGTSSNRSNAFAVAWDGTVTAAGEVKGASVEASVTLASGVTATTHAAKRSGNVVTVYVSELRLASELSNHATATVATVPSGYRPAYAAYAHLAGWNDGGSYVTVGTNGSVTLSNQSGASIPATRALGFTLTYVM